jgi:hypothetical protein
MKSQIKVHFYNLQMKLKNVLPVKTCRWALIPALLLTSFALADTSFEALESAMTTEERAQAGLSKLTKEELDFLNSWLAVRLVKIGDENALPPAGNIGSEEAIEVEVQRRVADELALKTASAKKAMRSQTYSATIIGDFSGWQGKTLFRLDNGEILRQKGASKYRYQGSDRTVSLKQNWAGGWEMEVIATGKRVLVKKIR